MSECDEEDLCSFMLDGYDSDVTSNGQRHHGRRGSRQERKTNLGERGGNLSSLSSSDNPSTAASRVQAGDANRDNRRKQATDRSGREHRQFDREMELALSCSIDDDTTVPQERRSRLKPPPTSTTQSPHLEKAQQPDDRYQVEYRVEARFGGRSKWYAGKVTRSYSGDKGGVYDIAYDDGDTEEGVLAARVRRPGQRPPSPRAGLAIDVKLARKGKGYHPAVIGRVNDDGTLYVKLNDGDEEWGFPAQQAIAHYSFEPAAERQRTSSDSSNLQHDTSGEGRETGDNNGERDVEQHLTTATSNENDTTIPKSPPCVLRTPREQEKVPVAATLRDSAGASLSTTSHGPVSPASATPSTVPDYINQHSRVAASEKLGSTSSSGGPHPTVTLSAPGADDKPGEEGSGLSWIADVAHSVGGSTLRSPGANPDAARSRSTADGVSSLPASGCFPAPAVTPSPGVLEDAKASEKPASGSATPTHLEWRSTTNASMNPSRNPSPIIAATTEPAEKSAFRSVTPTHLEWKPETDGSANRHWGAPPPDSDDLVATDQLQAPRLSAGTAPPTASHHTPEPVRFSAVDGTLNRVSEAPYERQTTAARAGTPESERRSAVTVEGRKQSPPTKFLADVPGETEDNRRIGPNSGDAVAKESGVMEITPVATAPKESTVSNESVAVVAGSGDGSAFTDAVEGKNGRMLWETLRASVQRRYAVEAMHLSEEVRLLKAKLKAADDNTSAKLKKQECKITAKFEGVLESEREIMNIALGGERAASARRIAALRNELETAKRRLEVEINRNSKRMTTGARDRSLQRPTTAPLLLGNGYAASKTTKHERAARHWKDRTTANSRKHSPSSGATPRLISTERPSLPPPPIPPARFPRHGQQRTSTSKPSGNSMSACPVPGTSWAAEGTPAHGPASEHLMAVFLDALESRDESIQKLLLRLRCVEKKHELIGVQPRPVHGAGSGEGEATEAGVEGENTSLEGAPPPLSARDPRTPGSVDRHGAIGWGASQTSQQSPLSFGKGHEKNDDGGVVATSQQQQDALKSGDHQYNDRDDLCWKMELERRDMRRRLDSMKSEMERVIDQFRARAERAEAKAASAEERARMKSLRYFESKL